jgi:hypothetical protein
LTFSIYPFLVSGFCYWLNLPWKRDESIMPLAVWRRMDEGFTAPTLPAGIVAGGLAAAKAAIAALVYGSGT